MPFVPPLLRFGPVALVSLVSVALVTAPTPVQAAPPSDSSPEAGDAEPGDAEPSPEPEIEPTPEPEIEPTPEPELVPDPEVTMEPAERPTGGGIGGSLVDPDDPNASRAQSDLEGESLDSDVTGVPERLPKLQTAGWWTTFGALTLATTGGVFAGIAETRQDEVERMAATFDLETGRATLYGDVATDYERALDQGRTYTGLAQGFLIAGGVTLIAAITLFAVDGARRGRARRARDARLQFNPGPGSFALQF